MYLGRWLRFWGRVQFVAGPILGILFALSVIMGLRVYQVSPTDVWPFCLLLDPSRPPADLGFWLFVLLNMLPSLVAGVMVCWLAARFVRSLYGLRSTKEGWNFLVYRLIGRPTFLPLLETVGGAVQQDEDHALRRVGGPGLMIVSNDSAVVTEKGGKLARVLGPGAYQLDSFEKVWDAIDLRQQPREPREFAVSAMTQDGLPITCHAEISFKIDDANQKSTFEIPHPMTEEAVFKAATCKWIREAWRAEPDDRLMTWTKMVIAETEGTLRSILARFPLDQLIDPTRRLETQRELEQNLERELHKSAPVLGAKIIRVTLGDIQTFENMTQQWIEEWLVKERRQMVDLEMEGSQVKTPPQIFLSYAREDEEKVKNLYQRLSDEGLKPWMAKEDIHPGEKWKYRIPQAIRRSDFFLACLSANSIDKRGFIQKEIKYALDIWQEKLDSDIYLIPVQLEDCEVPEGLRDFQWVNLFEEGGWTRLIEAIQAGMERQRK